MEKAYEAIQFPNVRRLSATSTLIKLIGVITEDNGDTSAKTPYRQTKKDSLYVRSKRKGAEHNSVSRYTMSVVEKGITHRKSSSQYVC